MSEPAGTSRLSIVDALLGEHGALRHQVDAFGLQAPRLSPSELAAVLLPLAEGIESHATLEDELLFDPLAASGRIPDGPLEAMRMEHREIVSMLEQLLRPAPAAGGADAERAAGERQRVARRLIETVRHHFAHEENVLFPLATRALGRGELEALGTRWAGRRAIDLRQPPSLG